MKYRKKPVVIDAIQWDGTDASTRQILEFRGQEVADDAMTQDKFYEYCEFVKEYGMAIQTLEGVHIASIDDYIIKGVKGEFYPCKPDIFEMTYETLFELN